MHWLVIMETRTPGAIGEFGQRAVTVSAADRDEALRLALQTIHGQGLETRFPVSVKEAQQ